MNTASEMGRDPSKGAHTGANLTTTSDNKSYSQTLEDEAGESRGVTAGPYLVIAVLAALSGIAFWLLL